MKVIDERRPPTPSVTNSRVGRFESNWRARIDQSEPNCSLVVLVLVPEIVTLATGDDMARLQEVVTPFVQTHSVRLLDQSSAGGGAACAVRKKPTRPATARSNTNALLDLPTGVILSDGKQEPPTRAGGAPC